MKFSSLTFKIVASQETCFLSLTHPRGDLPVIATLPYPNEVVESYARWQQAYLQFYRHYRGRREAGGMLLQEPVNLDTKLESARVDLLQKFEQWLKDGNLQSIRDSISGLRQQANVQPRLFLSCESLELARLPWEAWSLLQASASNTAQHSSHQTTNHPKISLFRIPGTGNEQKAQSHNKPKQRRRKPRILVIIGSDGYFNFQADFAKIQQKLAHKVDLQQAGWEPGIEPLALKQKLATAIADPIGWDMLYFAGHSNETQSTGGEFAIAPNLWLQMSELHPDLEIAIQNGLQFAFFNSCSGINIADSLLQMGLSQVAIMREPIANQVAEKIMGIFLEQLLEYHDVAVALAMACQQLEYSDRLKYPSAYLVPSFYCTPNTTLFQLDDNWRRWVKLWKPTKWEAIALTTLAILSWQPSIQLALLDQRLLVQAMYRNLTHQVPVEEPPTLLVRIDPPSLKAAKISNPNPMKRDYIAHIIKELDKLEAKIIGIDYIFDRPHPGEDPILGKQIRETVEKERKWIIFAAEFKESREEVGVDSSPNIASLNWTLQGYTNSSRQYVRLPSSVSKCHEACPFPYLLALIYTIANKDNLPDFPTPSLQNQKNLRSNIINYISNDTSNFNKLNHFKKFEFSSITKFSFRKNQQWFRPIIDFSIPPEKVYSIVSANQIQIVDSQKIKNRINLIVPGGYDEAGMLPGTDNFSAPSAIKYWRSRSPNLPLEISTETFTGAEVMAYTTHHLVNNWLIIPIPDLWMIGLFSLIGKMILLIEFKYGYKRLFLSFLVSSAIVLFVFSSLQMYIFYNLLIPITFPVSTLLVYLLITLRNAYSHD